MCIRDRLTGDVQILIGTHAVIEDTVNFSSLGFVVIDEQHLSLIHILPETTVLISSKVVI